MLLIPCATRRTKAIADNPESCRSPTRMRMSIATGRFLLLSLIVAILGGLLFTPGLPGEFLFDDLPNIVNNASIQMTTLDANALINAVATPQISGSMRGLPTLTFALDYWRGGGADPATFKITNILIHALTACAMAWFFRSLLLISGIPGVRVQWLAPALAFAWAAHPLQVSSVLYAVQRIQTLGTLFLILALWSYLTARQAQIEHRSGRTGLMLTGLFWAVAMGCKEDSALLPAYTLALELTVLRFAAANARLASLLRRSYLLATLVGATAYLLLVVPHYWQWSTIPGRDFSTPERLLTQARVICMYLWQALVPLPQHMPFYYDWLQPSRGLLQPWTTLASLAVIAALLIMAWWLRRSWPLFALGVFMFFGAHFIASNVVPLELAYEHRNHFALIGVVLALGSLLAHAGLRLRVLPAVQVALCAALLVGLGSATLLRAHTWKSNQSIARTGTEAAPRSPRAWIQLCAAYFESGGGPVPGNPHLDQAITACSAGAAATPNSLNNPALLIVLKSLRGNIVPLDWERFQQRLERAPMTPDNRRAPLILKHFVQQGVKLDKQELLQALATLVQRANPKPFDLSMIGYFVMNDLAEPDVALPYFIRAIEAASPNDPFAQQLAGELRAKDRPDLAERIELASLSRRMTPNPAGDETFATPGR